MKNRNKKTVFLGIFACLTFAWAAIYQFGVPPEELGALLLYSVIGVLVMALASGLTVGLLILLRGMWRKVRGAGDS